MRSIIRVAIVSWAALVAVVEGADRFVAPGASGGGASWADPMNIQNAVVGAAAGSTVWVTNGTYTLTGQLTVTNFTIRSFNNGAVDRDGTIIDGNNYAGKTVTNRCFTLNHAGAVVEGFIITNGATAGLEDGAGAYISAGTLRNCLVTGNVSTNAYVYPAGGQGGGVYATGSGSVITNCDIVANTCNYAGAGVFLAAGAKLRNSRVIKNTLTGFTSGGGGGGLFIWNSGEIYNSQVISNTIAGAAEGGGGIRLHQGGAGMTIRNCLVRSNSGDQLRVSGAAPVTIDNCTFDGNLGGTWSASTVKIENTIVMGTVGKATFSGISYYTLINSRMDSIPATNALLVVTSTNCITEDPAFMWRAGGDYRLAPWSRGVDAGVTQSWMSATTDLAGNPRISANNLPDMGAYETTAGGPAFTYYVARNGQAPVSPYTNGWAAAASNITDVLGVMSDGGTVLVTNGVYLLTNQVAVGYATLRSYNNGAVDREGTIIDGNNYVGKPVTNRCFTLSRADAVVEGFTITNGFVVGSHGGGVYMTAGTLRNCLVTGNTASNSSGGGVYLTGSGSLITNCDVIANAAIYAGGASSEGGGGVKLLGGARVWNSRIMQNRSPLGNTAGGGVNSSGGWVVNSQIISNTIPSGYGGGGVWVVGTGTVVRNCLIVGNGGGTANSGAGVGTAGGSPVIDNCTIVGNSGDGIGGYYQASTYNVANTVSYNNSGVAMRPSNTAGVGTLIASNCCATTTNYVTSGSGNITNDPQFASVAAGNYRLKHGSPCINNGVFLSWMTTGTVDLDGNPRISPSINGTVDMGAYEFPFQSGSVFTVR